MPDFSRRNASHVRDHRKTTKRSQLRLADVVLFDIMAIELADRLIDDSIFVQPLWIRKPAPTNGSVWPEVEVDDEDSEARIIDVRDYVASRPVGLIFAGWHFQVLQTAAIFAPQCSIEVI